MSDTVHFISGMPRAGSTLLLSILGQNPRFHVEGSSGLCELLVHVRNHWEKVQEFRAMWEQISDNKKYEVMQGIFYAYHRNDSAVSFDKSRSWLGHLEMLEAILESGPFKVLVCVRDVREVLCSFELLWRCTCDLHQIQPESQNYHAFQTMGGRVACWAASDGIVGLAYNRIMDAIRRGWRRNLFFVNFDYLTHDPASCMRDVEDFLEEKNHFEYDFENVRIPSHALEDDRAYEWPGLHQVRPKVEPVPKRWPQILGKLGEHYSKPQEDLVQAIKDRPREATMNGAPNKSEPQVSTVD